MSSGPAVRAERAVRRDAKAGFALEGRAVQAGDHSGIGAGPQLVRRTEGVERSGQVQGLDAIIAQCSATRIVESARCRPSRTVRAYDGAALSRWSGHLSDNTWTPPCFLGVAEWPRRSRKPVPGKSTSRRRGRATNRRAASIRFLILIVHHVVNCSKASALSTAEESNVLARRRTTGPEKAGKAARQAAIGPASRRFRPGEQMARNLDPDHPHPARMISGQRADSKVAIKVDLERVRLGKRANRCGHCGVLAAADAQNTLRTWSARCERSGFFRWRRTGRPCTQKHWRRRDGGGGRRVVGLDGHGQRQGDQPPSHR